MVSKWSVVGQRLEAILAKNKASNKSDYIVGRRLSYADVLVIHVMTWYLEEVRNVLIISIVAIEFTVAAVTII